MDNILINVFNNYYLYEEYKNVLDEPLDADFETEQKTENEYPHYQKCYLITDDNIKPLYQKVMIKYF